MFLKIVYSTFEGKCNYYNNTNIQVSQFLLPVRRIHFTNGTWGIKPTNANTIQEALERCRNIDSGKLATEKAKLKSSDFLFLLLVSKLFKPDHNLNAHKYK